MKHLVVILIFALAFSNAAFSQHFNHVIIVIQENRTPDNLFGADAANLPGADLQLNPAKGKALTLGTRGDSNPSNNHFHSGFLTEASGSYVKATYNYIAAGADPYWQIAEQYGFANYFYQTNQGSSLPAHQFLVSATSAPSDDSDLFVLDNPKPGSDSGSPTCKSKTGMAPTIAPDGTTGTVRSCFARSSLMTLLDAACLSWKYYAVGGEGLWDAPLSLQAYYKSKNIVLSPPQILSDIANCKLANVSWVTPANSYSDHPGGGGGGPAWVASIVNAVGESAYWEDTVIFVTWDDWGGWWDHIPPLANNTGWCQQICYGFRVPLLVISAVTPPNYVDNGTYDFGSIVKFVESNFLLGLVGPGTWADAYAGDLTLSGFFTGGEARRKFQPIKARRLTAKELADGDEPDDDGGKG